MDQDMRRELDELLRIPSISSGGGDPADLLRAAGWLKARIERSGGSAEIETTAGNPLVVGRLKSSTGDDVPTVLIYGHYDVQSPDPVDAWDSPPFEPEVRDERLYARGASDDKGNFYPLLYAACTMAEAGELPVDVRIVVEGEEEIGSDNIIRWALDDEEGADCSIIFDSGMIDADTPALTLGVRGMVMFEVTVRTGQRDLHSGMYGGSALNAIHVLMDLMREVLPDGDGVLRDELREGLLAPTDAEMEAWRSLPPGAQVVSDVGGRPISQAAVRDYYTRNWADASLDMHGFAGGDAYQIRTMIPVEARARFSIRLGPGQRADRIAETTVKLLKEAVPEGAEVNVEVESQNDPALVDPSSPAIELASKAFEEACGKAPALIRVGGSIPIMVAFARRGIPTILSGFALAEDSIHAPNESYRVAGLELGLATARALYQRLAELPRKG